MDLGLKLAKNWSRKMEEALIPLAGVKFEFQQPIQMRFNELMTGSETGRGH